MKKYLKNFIIFITLFIIFLFKDLFYLIPLKLLKIDYSSFNNTINMLLSILSSLILIIIIIIIYRKYLKEKYSEYKNNFGKYMELGFKYYIIGFFGMIIFNILISLLSPINQANNEELVQEMIKNAPFLSFVSAALIAPFIEEMLFRKSFGDIFSNKKIMFVASGLLFGLLHVIFSMETYWDLLYILPYGMLGGAFAYTIYKKDNIFIPITFHMIHNSVLILISIILTVIK